MADLICDMADCKHRSKRPLKKWRSKDGSRCYGCTLQYIITNCVVDPDGDIEATAGYASVSTAAADFEVELTLYSDESAGGYETYGGSEPFYAIDLTRYKYWLEAEIYYGEYGFSDNINFVPVDPATCPYANPYYIG